MIRSVWVASVLWVGCGGREVVTPSEPRAQPVCTGGCTDGKVYAVGTSLSFTNSWSGQCRDGKWHIGLEGGAPPVECDVQQYTLSLNCKKPGCVADSASGSVTLERAGRYTIGVKFVRSGASDKTVDIDVTAADTSWARVGCHVSTEDPTQGLVGIALFSKGNEALAGQIPTVTVGGGACALAAYDSDEVRFTCPLTTGSKQLDVAVKTNTFATTKNVPCT